LKSKGLGDLVGKGGAVGEREANAQPQFIRSMGNERKTVSLSTLFYYRKEREAVRRGGRKTAASIGESLRGLGDIQQPAEKEQTEHQVPSFLKWKPELGKRQDKHAKKQEFMNVITLSDFKKKGDFKGPEPLKELLVALKVESEEKKKRKQTTTRGRKGVYIPAKRRLFRSWRLVGLS